MANKDLSGEWLSRYSYHDGASGEHIVIFELREDGLLVGRGTDRFGSVLGLRLEHDITNNVLTGTWREQTSPSGEYGGAEFHGAVQFVVKPSLGSAEGKWVGFDKSRSVVNAGGWTLNRRG